MAQATIKSFFTPKKTRNSTHDCRDAKIRKLNAPKSVSEESTSFAPKPPKTPLFEYALSSTDGKSASSEQNNAAIDRHNAFYAYFSGLTKKASENSATGRRKMKPYDLQFIELKKQNMEAVLVIQNGYKYQILGEDAYRVARVLGRSPISGWRSLEDEGDPMDSLYDRFASLIFPIERLPYYLEKLVMQGFKVAVAKQLETSALKSQGDNKRGPFRREVTDTYTKGTMVEELTSSSLVTGHLLALTQQKGSKYALVAVQPATGDAIHDSFDDSSVAMELETRLLHIQPSEILIVGNPLEGMAAKLIDSLDVRVVHVKVSGNADTVGEIPDIIKENSGLFNCYTALYNYLLEFKLDHALKLDLHPFSLQSFMYLNGDTLQSLEIYENQTTNQPLGSLMWALDVTKTAFGRRLLRNWIGKPLMDRNLLAERVEAMEEIMNATGPAAQLFAAIQKVLPRIPDLERYTLQIYHGRIAPKQLYWCLYFFHLIVSGVTDPLIKAAKLHSPSLEKLLSCFEPTKRIIEPLLNCINGGYVRNSRDGATNNLDLASYFNLSTDEDSSQNDDFVNLETLDLQIANCRKEFTQFLEAESKTLGIPLHQANAFGEADTFVIGVPKKHSSKVPPSWRRQGAISTETRYWAPFSIEQTKKLKPLLEQQAAMAKETYNKFVARITENHFNELRQFVKSLAMLDCLFSMANVSSRPQYVKPDIVDEPCIDIKDGRHPMLEQIMLSSIIPNSVEMFNTYNRVMIITGANMGGKSSFVRQVALLVIMAQIGYYIPASKARLSIMDGIYTRMGAFDNLLRGESTFMVELKECASILSNATSRSLVIMDEIGRGTSTMDGVAIADAVLQYMIEDVKAFTLFITHYPLLCEKADNFCNLVQNWSMDCAELEDEVTFLYKVVRQKASRSYGINVARLAGLPDETLACAQQKSAEFEKIMETRRKGAQLFNAVTDVLKNSSSLDTLREFIMKDGDESNFSRDEIAETQDC